MSSRNGTDAAQHAVMARQEVGVAAPPAVVLDVIGACDFTAVPGASHVVSLLGREDARLIAAFSVKHELQQAHTIKEMIVDPDGRFTFRHLNGPFEGAVEILHILPASDGARLIFDAELQARDGSMPRLHRLSFEHAMQRYLMDVKRAAEARVQPLSPPDMPCTLIVPVTAIATEEDLIAAINVQEEAEWGHAGHGRGVERVALSLAEAVMLPPRQVEHLRRAAVLHDAGKLALDSSLWGTRGTLTPAQRTMMEAHARLGHDLVERVGIPDAVSSIILHHHERWDGTGYPERLAGEAIPLRARILFLAEVIDSMLRATYRRASLTPAQVSAVIEAGAGTIWDPMLARKAARIVRGK